MADDKDSLRSVRDLNLDLVDTTSLVEALKRRMNTLVLFCRPAGQDPLEPNKAWRAHYKGSFAECVELLHTANHHLYIESFPAQYPPDKRET